MGNCTGKQTILQLQIKNSNLEQKNRELLETMEKYEHLQKMERMECALTTNLKTPQKLASPYAYYASYRRFQLEQELGKRASLNIGRLLRKIMQEWKEMSEEQRKPILEEYERVLDVYKEATKSC